MNSLFRLVGASVTIGCIALAGLAVADSSAVQMDGQHLQTIRTGAIYPEGIEYNPVTGKFLLGSFREGCVYEVGGDGNARLLVQDDRLVTVLGIRVDATRNRLLVATADLGVSTRKSTAGASRFAALGIYELSTGKPLTFIDHLGSLRPAGEKHLANDLAIDSDGNAYVTDSLAPVIYRVDVAGKPSVFLENKDLFSGEGVNLNGIVFHPSGFLIVVKKSNGALFKVPLKDPKGVTEIKTSRTFVGGDGLVLARDNSLIVIANRIPGTVTNTAFALTSNDDWTSAEVTGAYKFAGDDYPTTGVVKDGRIFVSEGKINRLISDLAAEKAAGFSQKAVLQQVGTVVR